MPPVSYVSWIVVASIAGLLAGLGLLARGLSSYRTSLLVMDTSTSTISSVAAGEVRITGTIEAAELTLVSLLQGAPCVYYHASIGNAGDGSIPDASVSEERSVGFAVRDATGSLRIFPRGARVDAPLRFHDETGLAGDEPPGLAIRTGPATAATVVDRAAAIADLLSVHEPTSSTGLLTAGGVPREASRREYREWRLEVGDPVTIVGQASPFRDLDDPAGSNLGLGGDNLDGDPEVAADLAAARAAGALVGDPATAWGNAGIPGFGIGRPVTAPTIDPAADPLPLADAAAAASSARRFEIAPDALVIAASTDLPLLIAFGTPAAVVGRDQGRFALGLVGAGLAIGSALVLALSLSGGLGA